MKGHYLAYYQLHEIPWEITPPIKFRDSNTGIQFELSKGPFQLPRMAAPEVIIRAGGARVSMVNENFTIEGDDYLAIAIPVTINEPKNSLEPSQLELLQTSDDIAATVGLSLDQRAQLKKLASYVMSEPLPKSGKPMLRFLWQAVAGSKASISDNSISSIIKALDGVLEHKASPNLMVALRWYEISKEARVGPDRLLSLWIALEVIFGDTRPQSAIIGMLSNLLAQQEFELNLEPEQIKKGLGLQQIYEHRNAIVHKGQWLVPWPVELGNPKMRDWPQILCDVVGEVLRVKFGSAMNGSLKRHVLEGLAMSSN